MHDVILWLLDHLENVHEVIQDYIDSDNYIYLSHKMDNWTSLKKQQLVFIDW